MSWGWASGRASGRSPVWQKGWGRRGGKLAGLPVTSSSRKGTSSAPKLPRRSPPCDGFAPGGDPDASAPSEPSEKARSATAPPHTSHRGGQGGLTPATRGARGGGGSHTTLPRAPRKRRSLVPARTPNREQEGQPADGVPSSGPGPKSLLLMTGAGHPGPAAPRRGAQPEAQRPGPARGDPHPGLTNRDRSMARKSRGFATQHRTQVVGPRGRQTYARHEGVRAPRVGASRAGREARTASREGARGPPSCLSGPAPATVTHGPPRPTREAARGASGCGCMCVCLKRDISV